MKKLKIALVAVFLGLTTYALMVRADSTTTRAGLTKPSVGSTGWGVKLNADMDLIDSAFGVYGSTGSWTAGQSFSTATITACAISTATISAVTNATNFTSGLKFGNATSDSNLGTITSVTNTNFYQGTFNATFTGPGSSGAQTIGYQRIGRMVTLTIPFFTPSCSVGTFFAAGAATVPSSLRPGSGNTTDFPVLVRDAGSITSPSGMFTVGSDGNLQIYKTTARGTFSTSSTCGLEDTINVTYQAGF